MCSILFYVMFNNGVRWNEEIKEMSMEKDDVKFRKRPGRLRSRSQADREHWAKHGPAWKYWVAWRASLLTFSHLPYIAKIWHSRFWHVPNVCRLRSEKMNPQEQWGPAKICTLLEDNKKSSITWFTQARPNIVQTIFILEQYIIAFPISHSPHSV